VELLAGSPHIQSRFVPCPRVHPLSIADFEQLGERDFPFSFLLPGHLPATTHGALSSIDYVLKAEATSKTGETITFNKGLSVKRSIQPSELPRQSIRIFPPTNLTSHIELPSVIHPIGEYKCSLRIDGIVKRNVEARTQTHWKLKRLTWRIEETQNVISPACPKHAAKAGAGPDEKKGVVHQDVKILNTQELKNGWKADYASGAEGSVEMEFRFSIRADSKPQCDVKAADGTEISHSLVVEMIVAEEVAPITKPSHATPTGAARVLRMNFNVPVTERSGLGVSWDEEQPPLYENVPASPPGYGGTEEYTGPAIPDYEELETLRG
jgi:arrestin-related trafficking adapter 1